MYITHSFVGIKKGGVDYLIFYLTEDYIEEQIHFTQRLEPLLNALGEQLQNKGAVVKPFRNRINDVNFELAQEWEKVFEKEQQFRRLYNEIERPALLIMNSEINELSDNNFLLISLQDFKNYGNFDVDNINEFFRFLIEIVHSNLDLISETKKYIKKRNLKNAKKIMNINPALFGIGINGKEALKAFKSFLKNRF